MELPMFCFGIRRAFLSSEYREKLFISTKTESGSGNLRLKWDDHIAAITSEAAKRLWFLKKLKRAGVARKDLLYLYQAVVQPVLDYTCPTWHTSITKDHTKSLEDIQRPALHIRSSSAASHTKKHVVC